MTTKKHSQAWHDLTVHFPEEKANAENLKILYESSGLYIRECADLIHVLPRTFANWLDGTHKVPQGMYELLKIRTNQ